MAKTATLSLLVSLFWIEGPSSRSSSAAEFGSSFFLSIISYSKITALIAWLRASSCLLSYDKTAQMFKWVSAYVSGLYNLLSMVSARYKKFSAVLIFPIRL